MRRRKWPICCGNDPSPTCRPGLSRCRGRPERGTGARINNPGGQVSLQLARSSGPRDISRVTAKEDVNGYAASWNVTAYAICTNPLAGFTAQSRLSMQTGSQDTKLVEVECPSGTFVHNAAAAIGGILPVLGTAPPGVAIQVMFPFNDLKRVRVFAVETTPTNASWNLVAQAICGP
jgi:hypothetical protein